jgi:MoaA/NifB/PqqE/SkfB family radical SAM enzyme
MYPKTTEEVNKYVRETNTVKCYKSPNYNFLFDKVTGDFARWGKTMQDDPIFAPAPEIADIEISVNGCPNRCKFCYKGNTPDAPSNMSFETYKQILDCFARPLVQVALGITGIQTNPDLIKILEYTRSKGIIPNFTLTGADLIDDLAEKTAKLVGAVAVSVQRENKDICYNTVAKYSSLGLKQVNIHILTSFETLDFIYEVLEDIKNDKRLSGLNAIVLLGVKPKGRAKGQFTPLHQHDMNDLINYCFEHEISFGCDSCSAPKCSSAVDANSNLSKEQKVKLQTSIEPCESDLFSCYVNVKGEFWHCSFAENEPNVKTISLLDVKDFVAEVWYSAPVEAFRKKLLANNRHCPIHDIG